MPTTAEIKKGKGIDDLFRGFDAEKPEEEKPIEVVGADRFKALTAAYERLLEVETIPEADEEMEKMTLVLTPNDINAFLQTIFRYEQNIKYSWRTGELISKLIQNSYNAGYNDFNLSTVNLKKIHDVGIELKGRKEQPIRITVIGNTGDHCGIRSKNLIYHIQGNTGDNYGHRSEDSIFTVQGNTSNTCGWGAKNSTFNIQGNTGNSCGASSENLTVHIQGSAGTVCGYQSIDSTYNIQGSTADRCGFRSVNSAFCIKGDTGSDCGSVSRKSIFKIQGKIGDKCGNDAEHSIFKTSNKETLEKMLEYVPERIVIFPGVRTYKSGNRVVFIHPDGREEVMRDYDDS